MFQRIYQLPVCNVVFVIASAQCERTNPEALGLRKKEITKSLAMVFGLFCPLIKFTKRIGHEVSTFKTRCANCKKSQSNLIFIRARFINEVGSFFFKWFQYEKFWNEAKLQMPWITFELFGVVGYCSWNPDYFNSTHFIFKFPPQNYEANFLQRQKSQKLQFYLLNDALQKEQKSQKWVSHSRGFY